MELHQYTRLADYCRDLLRQYRTDRNLVHLPMNEKCQATTRLCSYCAN